MASERRDQQGELRRQLTTALLTPLLLLLAVGGLLGWQVARMAETARWVDHTDEVIALAQEAFRSILDQESALRGYLISGDQAALEPYHAARPIETLARLRAEVSDNAPQQERLDDLRHQYELWAADAGAVARAAPAASKQVAEGVLSRKRRMDAMRAEFRRFLEVEVSLRRERVISSAQATRVTMTAFVVLIAALGLGLAFLSRRQLGAIARTYGEALGSEQEARAAVEAQAWVRAGHIKLSEALQGDVSTEELASRALGQLARYVGADVGALYVAEGEGFRRRAGHALDAAAPAEAFKAGQGLVGQAAVEGGVKHLREVPGDYLKVRSGVGERAPVEIVVAPARVEGRVHAVVELGFLRGAEPRVVALLEAAGETLALGVRSAEYKARLRALLDETQQQAEELQAQQEELRVSNEELEEQGRTLREAQRQGEVQQAELEQVNENLSEQTALLERQNDDLRAAQGEIAARAAEVARTNRYKSEFLSNMSHELRTPLNSSLILAKLLADNKGGNLTDEQVKFAETIYGAGNDLLALINDILDLAKIEAGKMEVQAEATTLGRLVSPLERVFEPVARDKGLAFAVQVGGDGPVETDVRRAQQVLKNLLSNALKFTERGGVTLRASLEGEALRVEVRDTGIGIAPEQHEAVFEAFRQADGTTNRKYGGTGLGLSISRDLARLLGGELSLESQPGRGSTFVLTLPRVYRAPEPGDPARPAAEGQAPVASASAPQAPAFASAPRAPAFASGPRAPAAEVPPWRPAPAPSPGPALARPAGASDDRDALERGRRLVLIIEDDPSFAGIVLDLARELDFQGVIAPNADEGLRLAAELGPSAIVLDMHLPDRSGLAVLDRLKHEPATRHIPVHIVSATDFSQTALEMGAVGYAVKPVKREELAGAFRRLEATFSRRGRRLLIVEDDPVQRDGIARLLGGEGVEAVGVGSVGEALVQLRASTFDCVVTDLSLPDASGYDLLETMAADEAYAFPPVIVYTGRSLTADEEQRLRRYSSAIIVKGARSPERLLDEVTLFLHQVEAELPAERQRMLRQARDREAVFEGRRVLVVEDDVRNVFALTSVLEPKGAEVLVARNGREALEALRREPRVDLVLMDIMMPEMDGLEATAEIRKEPRWAKLPVIALTAKAMRDDQERCLRAGANDYIAKPLDVEMLLSLLRVWMPK